VSPLALFVLGLLLMGLVMALVFVAALRLRNFSIVDVAWSANFTPLALLYAAFGGGHGPRRALIAGMVTLWSLRLAAHLGARIGALHPEEEGRYVQLRREWAASLNARFFAFFQAQGLLNAVLSVPFLIACVDRRGALGAFEIAGATLFAVALAGEAVADRQLASFKADPANRGRTCRAGLWRYSRHPNYFFEWLAWVAYFVFALPSPWGWTSVLCPLLMLLFLFRVTGIPMTEEQALRSRGDDYRDYQRTTSAFFPWLPKPMNAGPHAGG
jgi:steroid 5-alpha reductase family enzyme